MLKEISFRIFAASVVLAMSASAAWSKEISCSPSEVQSGGKLVIKITKAFPDFAVITPKKVGGVNYFFLNETGAGLVSSAQFVRNRGITIDVDTAMLDPKSKLFDAPGIYQFKVSTNLETDDGTPSFSCKVKFSGQKKPSAQVPASNTKGSGAESTNKTNVSAASQKPDVVKTVDQQLAEAVASQCSPGLAGLLCREKFRLSLCANKWSDNPAPGEAACMNSR